MARKNQYVLYLDKLEKFIESYILKADISIVQKDERLNTVYALISSCVPYYAEHALASVMYNINREANKARMDRMAEYHRKKSLSSSRMTKRTTVSKKKRC